ncbi:MAG: FG-GAP-like repeat-containing protein [Rhodanobacter sp.]
MRGFVPAVVPCTLALIAVLMSAGMAATTPTASADIAKAQALVAQGKFAAAVPALELVLKAHPRNGRAWLLLASAQGQLHHVVEAETAYRHGLSIDAVVRPATEGMFLLLAGSDRADAAWPWFVKMRDARMGDLTELALHPEIAGLHDDPRFATLFADKIAYEPAFVEKVRVIHEWRGEHAGDEFGWIARAVGDVDHDGVSDVVVSAPAHPPQGHGPGSIYLYSGKSGKLLWKHRGSGVDLLGNGVEAAGDVDRDGVPDVIAGAPGAGKAYVLSGKDGSVLRTLSGHPGDKGFGTAVAGIGDLDGDGYPELAVGAPASANGQPGDNAYRGYAYIYSGKDGKLLRRLTGETVGARLGSALGGGSGFLIVGAGGGGPDHHGRVYVYDKLQGPPRFVKDADATGGALGAMFVSVAGDINRDGIADIYAADWANAAKGPSAGRVYVYSGADGSTLLTLDGSGPGEGFGTCAAKTGDVNGDGIADLVVGSWQYPGDAWSGGRVAVYSGSNGAVLQSFTGKVPGDTLGFDAVGIGDVDGDGKTDYLITSAWSMVNGIRSGRAYIVAGQTGAGSLSEGASRPPRVSVKAGQQRLEAGLVAQ